MSPPSDTYAEITARKYLKWAARLAWCVAIFLPLYLGSVHAIKLRHGGTAALDLAIWVVFVLLWLSAIGAMSAVCFALSLRRPSNRSVAESTGEYATGTGELVLTATKRPRLAVAYLVMLFCVPICACFYQAIRTGGSAGWLVGGAFALLLVVALLELLVRRVVFGTAQILYRSTWGGRQHIVYTDIVRIEGAGPGWVTVVTGDAKPRRLPLFHLDGFSFWIAVRERSGQMVPYVSESGQVFTDYD